MDLGTESSSSKSNHEEEKMASFDAKSEEINGEMGFEEKSEISNHPFGEEEGVEELIEPKVNRSGIGDKNKDKLSPKSIGSSSNSNLEVNSTPSKGKGLKKWRRIRRDLNKDESGGVDSSLILKRRHSLNETLKGRDDNKMKNVAVGKPETPTPSVGSLRSVEAIVEAVGLDPELVQLMASGGFSIGIDSDNSEDRSSKSSTAASVPKPRHEVGFGRERGWTKMIGGRVAGNALQQRAQRGKGAGVEVSKKIRDDRVRLEKDNSQSSVESDLRSSNMGFTRWGSRVSNGKHSEKSLNFDGDHGDEAQPFEEVRSGYYEENGVTKDLLRGDLGSDLLEEENKVRRENFRPPSGINPFVESIVMLQAAQEALETEIQKIREIGKATEHDDFDDQSAETKVSSSPTLDAHSLELNRKIENLQYKLEEASATVKAKEIKVLELKDIIMSAQFPKNEASSTNISIPEEMHDLEVELEDLLKKKIQAEVEFLIVTRTTQSWKILAEDQIALLESQQSLARDQAQVMLKLRDAEEKAIKLKKQAEEIYCRELLGTETILKLQSKVCKFSFCSFIQLLLLCVAFGLFLMQLMPPSDEFVPT